MVAILPVLAVLLIGAELLGATTLQSYGLALFVGLLSGAYSSIFIASPVLCMMKEARRPLGADRRPLGQAGSVDGLLFGGRRRHHEHRVISVAASGQVNRAAGPGAEGWRQAQRADPTGLGQRWWERLTAPAAPAGPVAGEQR